MPAPQRQTFKHPLPVRADCFFKRVPEGRTAGFTLIELIVVLSILAGLLVFSLPVFRKVDLFSNTDTQAGQIARLVNDLKNRAMENNTDIILHVETAGQTIWVSTQGMDEDALEEARSNGFSLPDGLVILDVEFPDAKQSSADYQIRFRKQGYSDFALIHMNNGEDNLTLKIEPFISKALLLDEHVSFEDCI